MADKIVKADAVSGSLVQDIRRIIAQGRSMAYASVNAVMIDTYWKIGQRIVEEEQHGSKRAEYGTALLKNLAAILSAEFGKGFEARDLRNCRQFYRCFPSEKIWNTRVPNLSWSHFRTVLRVARRKDGVFRSCA